MAKRQGPQSFAKRQRERQKQMRKVEKAEKRQERKESAAAGDAPPVVREHELDEEGNLRPLRD
jgi:hypothetical protein